MVCGRTSDQAPLETYDGDGGVWVCQLHRNAWREQQATLNAARRLITGLRLTAPAGQQQRTQSGAEGAAEPTRRRKPGRPSPVSNEWIREKAEAYEEECRARGNPYTTGGFAKSINVKWDTASNYLARIGRVYGPN